MSSIYVKTTIDGVACYFFHIKKFPLLKPDDSDATSSDRNETAPSDTDISSRKRLHDKSQSDTGYHHKIQKPGNKYFLSSRKLKEIPGHTGYLTFATLIPSFKN